MFPPLTHDPASAGFFFVQPIFTPYLVLLLIGRLIIIHKAPTLMDDDHTQGKDGEQKGMDGKEDTTEKRGEHSSGSPSETHRNMNNG